MSAGEGVGAGRQPGFVGCRGRSSAMRISSHWTLMRALDALSLDHRTRDAFRHCVGRRPSRTRQQETGAAPRAPVSFTLGSRTSTPRR